MTQFCIFNLGKKPYVIFLKIYLKIGYLTIKLNKEHTLGHKQCNKLQNNSELSHNNTLK